MHIQLDQTTYFGLPFSSSFNGIETSNAGNALHSLQTIDESFVRLFTGCPLSNSLAFVYYPY